MIHHCINVHVYQYVTIYVIFTNYIIIKLIIKDTQYISINISINSYTILYYTLWFALTGIL